MPTNQIGIRESGRALRLVIGMAVSRREPRCVLVYRFEPATAWAAFTMWSVTACGWEIMITCEPSTSAMSAPARGVGRIGDKDPGRVLVCHGRPPGQVTPNAVLPTPGAGAPGGWRGLDRRGVGY